MSDAAVWTTGVSQKSKCRRRFAVIKSESKNIQSTESTTLSIAAEVKYFKTFCVCFAVKGLEFLKIKDHISSERGSLLHSVLSLRSL